MISIVIAVIFICLGGAILAYASQFVYTVTDPLGPMFFPQVLAGALIVLSFIVIVQRFKDGSLSERIQISVFTLPVISGVYVAALFKFGFIFSTLPFVLLATPFFRLANNFVLKDYFYELKAWLKRPSIYVLLAFLFIMVWGVFIQFLHIPLPLWGNIS